MDSQCSILKITDSSLHTHNHNCWVQYQVNRIHLLSSPLMRKSRIIASTVLLKERSLLHTKSKANSINNERDHSQNYHKGETRIFLTKVTEHIPALQEEMGIVTETVAWTDQSPQALSAHETTQNVSRIGLPPGHNAPATRMWGSMRSRKRRTRNLPGANSKPKRVKSARDCHWPALPVDGKR